MKKIGAEILINCLKEQGVDTVFGYPGGTVLDIYDALYRDGNIRHVITSHEQGAAHAADGYARSTGKVGVCIATSGPGATNLVTGIATAFMDSIPLVAITGNVGIQMLGRDSFQEIDITCITMPITKHNFIVKDVNELADVVREAFLIANSGRKGPVLIDILKNVQIAEADYEAAIPVKKARKPVAKEAVESAAEAITKSTRPLIMVGGGTVASEAAEEVRHLAEKLNAPVACTLMGLGAFPASHPLFVGMMGMHGTATAAKACMESDCIIAVGTRFSDRVALNRDRFAKDKTVVQIDIDDSEINKNVPVTHSVLGDVKESLKTLLPLLADAKSHAFADKVSAWKKEETKKAKMPELGHKIIMEAARLAPKEHVVCTDVGQHQMWTAQYVTFDRPRRFVSSGGLGTMGFGLGAAMGAYVATKDPTVLITGDGSFGMNLNELATAVTYKIPVVIVLLNNGVLGMVRQWQTLFFGKRYSNTILERKTDFVKLAQAFGADGYLAETPVEFKKAFEKAIASGKPTVIDVRIDKDELVLPMLPPGGAISDIITKVKA